MKLKFEPKKFSLEEGIWQEARREGLTLTEKLAQLERKEKLEIPEEILGETDAFERQLAAHEIFVNSQASLVGDFFKTSSSKILFPEFIDRNVKLGLQLGKLEVRLEDTFAVSQKVPSLTVSPFDYDFDQEDVRAKRKSEGGKFAKMTVGIKDKSVKLGTVGRELDISYKALLTMQNLEAAMIFQRFGHKLARDMTAEALRVIKDGDGNSGSAAATSTARGTWTYAEVVKLLFKFEDGHEATHIAVNPEFLLTLLTDAANFPQFQSRNILENYMKTGELEDFFGIKWRTHKGLDNETALIWEKDSCLKKYELAGSYVQETERIIREQIQGTVISVDFAFAKMFDAACHYKTKS